MGFLLLFCFVLFWFQHMGFSQLVSSSFFNSGICELESYIHYQVLLQLYFYEVSASMGWLLLRRFQA